MRRRTATRYSVITNANAINATLYDNLSFDFIRDIVPVASIIRVPFVMVVNPSVAAKTVPELIAYAKANPGKLTLASSGKGTVSHVAGELFKMMTEVQMLSRALSRRPARERRPDRPAMCRRCSTRCPPPSSYIKAGKLRALATIDEKRSAALPDVPLMTDFVPGYDASALFGIGVPKGTPRRDRRTSQQGDQRHSRRPRASRRSLPISAPPLRWLACGVWQADRHRNREVGQGGEVLRRQGGVTLPGNFAPSALPLSRLRERVRERRR